VTLIQDPEPRFEKIDEFARSLGESYTTALSFNLTDSALERCSAAVKNLFCGQLWTEVRRISLPFEPLGHLN